jgi:hypothetical protein
MNDLNNTSSETPFDVDAFMNTTYDEPMATTMSNMPDGEYTAMIGDFDSSALKTIVTRNGGRQVLEIPFILRDDDGGLAAKLGAREQYVHRETYWLDFTENGGLAFGPDKNIRLGQLRAALGQNEKGIPWAPSMLRNMGPVKIALKTTSDKKDPEKKYTNIAKYARIS